jgi:RimJ/RimL family protein N-acetyltransferase
MSGMSGMSPMTSAPTGLDPDRWRTRRVHLKRFEDSDVGPYVELCSSLDVGRQFRFGGAAIPPPAMLSAVWDGTLVHLVGVGNRTRRRLGVASVTSADMRNGTAYLSVVSDPAVVGSGLMIEVAGLAIEYVFSTWPFRKLYAEVPEYNLRTFGSVTKRFFRREGLMTEHVFLDGRYWDVHVLATDRATWEREGSPLVTRLRERRGSGYPSGSRTRDGAVSAVPGAR